MPIWQQAGWPLTPSTDRNQVCLDAVTPGSSQNSEGSRQRAGLQRPGGAEGFALRRVQEEVATGVSVGKKGMLGSRAEKGCMLTQQKLQRDFQCCYSLRGQA